MVNADALSRLPSGPDQQFDREEEEADVDTVCCIKTIGSQLNATDPGVLTKESSRDPVIANVIRFTREGWPAKSEIQDQAHGAHSMEDYRKISTLLSSVHDCLLYGARVVIPPCLQTQLLQILHLGHFGIQRMKQMARTAVYWPGIDSDIVNLCHKCSTCAEHQSSPPKQANHPWMLPEKPWSRIHLDHAVTFLGQTGWSWWIPIQSTPVFTQQVRCLPKQPPTYWNRSLHTLGTPTLLSQTIQLHSFLRNFNCGVVREESPT